MDVGRYCEPVSSDMRPEALWGASAGSGHTQLVRSLRAANPDVKIFVAKIIPMHVTSKTCSGCTCDACAMGIAANWDKALETLPQFSFPF